jgi:hypothetical protein
MIQKGDVVLPGKSSWVWDLLKYLEYYVYEKSDVQ